MSDRRDIQPELIPTPEGLGGDVIISPDTLGGNRLPPRQSRTRKWPVLDAFGPPDIDLDEWQFEIGGLVESSLALNWEEFQKLPRVKVFADMHCVTRWSRLGNLWEGVSTAEVMARVRVLPQARMFSSTPTMATGLLTCLSTTSWPKTLFLRILTTVSPFHRSMAGPFALWFPGSTPERAPSGLRALSSWLVTNRGSGSAADTTCEAIHGKKNGSVSPAIPSSSGDGMTRRMTLAFLALYLSMPIMLAAAENQRLNSLSRDQTSSAESLARNAPLSDPTT